MILFYSLFEDIKDEAVSPIQVFYPFPTCQDIPRSYFSSTETSWWLLRSFRVLWSCEDTGRSGVFLQVIFQLHLPSYQQSQFFLQMIYFPFFWRLFLMLPSLFLHIVRMKQSCQCNNVESYGKRFSPLIIILFKKQWGFQKKKISTPHIYIKQMADFLPFPAVMWLTNRCFLCSNIWYMFLCLALDYFIFCILYYVFGILFFLYWLSVPIF